MLIEVIALGVLCGRLIGGKVSRLSDIHFRGAGLLFSALAVQAALRASAPLGETVPYYLLLLSYLLVLTALGLNRSNRAALVMGGGVLLNLVVIAANGGMPVAAPASTGGFNDGIHIPLAESARLTWLGDVITWPLPGPLGGLVSAGDLLLSAGVFLFIIGGMSYRGKRRFAPRSQTVRR